MNTIKTRSKVLAKNSFLNLLGMLIPSLIGIVSIPLAIKGLGAGGFGLLSIAWVTLSYLVLLDLGISRSSTRFIAENLRTNGDKQSAIFSASIILGFVAGILGGLILFITTPTLLNNVLKIDADSMQEASQIFLYIAVGLPFILVGFSLKGMLGAVQRFDIVNAITIPINSLNFIFPALSYFAGISISTVMLFIVLSRITATLFYLYYCRKILHIKIRAVSLDVHVIKKVLSYGGWITVTGIVSPLLVYIDRFFIGSFVSMQALAYYAAPLEAITRFRVFPEAIMVTLFPEFSVGLTGTKNDLQLYQLFTKSLKLIMILSGMISLFLFSHSYDILHLWLGQEFVDNSLSVFKIFAVSISINFLAFVPYYFLQGIGRPDIPAKFHIIEFCFYSIILWLFVKEFGIVGAAWGWMLRVSVDVVLLYMGCFKVAPGLIPYVKKENFAIIGGLFIGLGSIPVLVSYSPLHIVSRLLISLSIFLLLGYSLWKFAFSPDEQKWLYMIVAKFKKTKFKKE